MDPDEMLQECDREVQVLLPEVPRPEQKALATVLCGVVAAGSVVLSQVSLRMPGAATAPSQQQRAQRLVSNERLEVARAQRRLLRRVLGQQRGRSGRVDLLLDATVRGTTAHHAGTVTWCLALAWHRRALPLVWRTWASQARDQDWRGAMRAMVAAVQAELPPGVEVVVLVDRGLSGAELARTVLAAGWHFLWRVIRTTRLRQADGTVGVSGALVTAPGQRVYVNASRLYAPRTNGRAGAGAGGWQSHWDQAVAANGVAVWRRGEADPWLVATDLPACGARVVEYRRRTWEEELFRDLNSLGWQWQASRIRDPEHVQRLLLVLALATLWMVALAQRLVRRGQRRQVDTRHRRTYSYFQLGRRWFAHRLTTHLPIPCLFSLWAEPSAPLKLS